MSRVRALDSSHDWLFGKGQNDYLTQNAAIVQNINTRLSSFLNKCFFDMSAGIDWINLLGGKNQSAINLAISTTILNTANVTGIRQLTVNLNNVTRLFSVSYTVITTYSSAASIYQFDLGGTQNA